MKFSRIFKLVIFLAVAGLCFALDAGLGLMGGAMALALAGAGGSTEGVDEKFQKAIDEAVEKATNNVVLENQKTLIDILEQQKQLVALAKAEPVSLDAKVKLLHEDKNYRAAAFFKALKNNDDEMLAKITEIEGKAITAPGTEGTAADGGTLVPTLTDASIKEVAVTSGQILGLATNYPMAKGNTVTLPTLSTRVAGAWYAENGQIVPEKQTFGTLSLAPKKWAGMLPISNELFQDATPEIGGYLIKVLGTAEGYALDGKCFQAGNTTLTGLYYASSSFGNTETITGTDPDGITYRNLVACALGLDRAALGNAKWYMSRSVLSSIMNKLDQNNRPIFDFNTQLLLGYPVVILEQAPTSAILASKVFILFGDISNAYVGDVAGRRVDIFKEGSVTINGSLISMMEYDLSAIRVIKRYAFDYLAGAFSVCKTSAS